MKAVSLFFLVILGVVSSLSSSPFTQKHRVSDVFHGVTVTEDYRWLEDLSEPEVRSWTDAQNQLTREYLNSLDGLDEIRAEVASVLGASDVSYGSVTYVGGKYFALKYQPPHQQPFLLTFSSFDALNESQILVDPNTLNPNGTTAIDWFHPSPDGKLLAVSLSTGGSEAGDVYIFDTSTGKQVFEVIPRVNTGTAGGDLAWAPDSLGFYYTRHPREGEREKKDLNFFQQAYFHRLGTDTSEDRYELGEDFPRIAEIEFEVHRESGQVLMTVQDGDGGEFAHFVRAVDGSWRQFSEFGDKLIQATFGGDQSLFALSTKGAPRGKILKLDLETLDLAQAVVVVEESEATIVNSFYQSPPSIVVSKSRLYVLYQKGGPSEILAFDFDGNPVDAPEQNPVANIDGMCLLDGDDLLFYSRTYTAPKEYFCLDASKDITEVLPLSSVSPVDFSDVIVTREYATSKDGTMIPVNIMMSSSSRGKVSPCIVYGYGGYGVNLTPRFRPELKVLLDRGFVYAVANIRGGGEFGEEWHQQGMLTNKQNVFDDFAAAAEFLVNRGYTNQRLLSIMGGSNGGLLMGATLTQRPQLARAVVSYVGIYDMIRSELSPNGSFNIPEFGTIKNPEHFKALHAYSPYHNVVDETTYPAVFFLTGENDPRVDPMQSRKMTARLQGATASEHPILLRSSSNSGHGLDTPLSEQIEETAAVYSFLLHELGIE